MRDLRDPTAVGEALLAARFNHQGVRWHSGKGDTDRVPVPLSKIYDQFVRGMLLPDYAHDESMAAVTAREYRQELEARVAEGDKYAKSALEQLRMGQPVQGYDDAG